MSIDPPASVDRLVRVRSVVTWSVGDTSFASWWRAVEGEAGWRDGRREEAGALLLAQAGALAADVEDVAVVQEPVEDRGGDHGVAAHLAPLAEALVGREDH